MDLIKFLFYIVHIYFYCPLRFEDAHAFRRWCHTQSFHYANWNVFFYVYTHCYTHTTRSNKIICKATQWQSPYQDNLAAPDYLEDVQGEGILIVVPADASIVDIEIKSRI